MLLRLCPGLTAYKSLDQTQHGIKLTTVQIEYSTCVCGAGTQLASKVASRMMHNGSTVPMLSFTANRLSPLPLTAQPLRKQVV